MICLPLILFIFPKEEKKNNFTQDFLVVVVTQSPILQVLYENKYHFWHQASKTQSFTMSQKNSNDTNFLND